MVSAAILLGCCLIAAVIGHGLRRVRRALYGIGLILEASVNRAARNRGDAPISDDIDIKSL